MGEIARAANRASEAATEPYDLQGLPICGIPASVVLTLGGNPVELTMADLIALRPMPQFLIPDNGNRRGLQGNCRFQSGFEDTLFLAIGQFEWEGHWT